MRFSLEVNPGEVRVMLTESLALPEGQSVLLESCAAQEAYRLLPQIESLVRQFLSGFEGVLDGSP